jgi:hypothetical protein
MLLILCALVALIGMMGYGAVRVARAMTGRRGTEDRATRLNLSTEAQATRTEAQAASTGRPSGRKVKPPLPPLCQYCSARILRQGIGMIFARCLYAYP